MGVALSPKKLKTEHWFHKKPLTFECTKCGDCCKRPGYVYLYASEAERIAKRILGDDATAASLIGELWVEEIDGSFRLDVPENEACPLLGPTGCVVHDIKPMQCATYPFWGELLARESSWEVERQACEGIGKGRTYSVEEIEDLLSECGRTSESLNPTDAGARADGKVKP